MERPVQVAPLRATARHPVFEFGGVRYYRKPPGYFKSMRGEYLHRAVWEVAHGPIPDGWHVHHVDGDRGNNDPSNLECLPGADHGALHMESPERRAEAAAALQPAVERAAQWRRAHPEQASAIGRAGGAAAAAAMVRVECACTWCGRQFAGVASRTRRGFCSPSCQGMARKASGVDREARECAVCGGAFSVDRYARTRSCSPGCAARLRTAGGVQHRSGGGPLLLR